MYFKDFFSNIKVFDPTAMPYQLPGEINITRAAVSQVVRHFKKVIMIVKFSYVRRFIYNILNPTPDSNDILVLKQK